MKKKIQSEIEVVKKLKMYQALIFDREILIKTKKL